MERNMQTDLKQDVSFACITDSLLKQYYPSQEPLALGDLTHLRGGETAKVHVAGAGASGTRIAAITKRLDDGTFLAMIYKPMNPIPEGEYVINISNIIAVTMHRPEEKCIVKADNGDEILVMVHRRADQICHGMILGRKKPTESKFDIDIPEYCQFMERSVVRWVE